MSSTTASGGGKFELLQVGRGVAATMVVLYHGARIIAEPRFWGIAPFDGVFRNFNVGVDFFFVLSGFIITWAHWDDLGQPHRVGSYLKKRLLRIYPPYWGVLIPLVLFYLLSGTGDADQRDPLNIALSLFLTPNPIQPVLGVAWTLTFEIFFYALFTTFIVAGRRGMLILPIWAVMVVIAQFTAAKLSFPASFLLSPFNLEFIGGVGIAALLRRGSIPAPTLLAATALCGFVILLFVPGIQDHELVARVAFGSMALLFVIGAVARERRRPIGALPPWLTLFGASSYSLYLVHPLILIAACQILARSGGRALPGEAAVLMVAGVAVCGGTAYHVLVERPLVAAMRRWLWPTPPSNVKRQTSDR